MLLELIPLSPSYSYYCNHLRARELELMRVIATRFPERNIARLKRTIDPVTGEVLLLPPAPEDAASSSASASSSSSIPTTLADAVKSTPPPPPAVPAKQGRKDWVDVTDEDGNFVGRVSPGMADLAKKRGAREKFSEARGDGDKAERVTVVGEGVEGSEAGSKDGKWKKGSWWRLGL